VVPGLGYRKITENGGLPYQGCPCPAKLQGRD
jgi:hypothetical protein